MKTAKSLDLAERLRLLTLALEQALQEGDLAAVAALFAQRDALTTELETRRLDARTRKALAEIEREGDRILAQFAGWRAETVRVLASGQKSRRVASPYSGGSSGACPGLDTSR